MLLQLKLAVLFQICWIFIFGNSHSRLKTDTFAKPPGLWAVTAAYEAVYYCDRGASIEDPTDGVTGNICPAGRYCGRPYIYISITLYKLEY